MIARHEGQAPEGWMGPWVSETFITPDLVAEAGYTYLLDWAPDDQPLWFATRSGRKLVGRRRQDLAQRAGEDTSRPAGLYAGECSAAHH